MLRRAREQDGFMMIEVVAATVILSIALLALMAGYDSAFVSQHQASQRSTAATLANEQLERFRAIPYLNLGLNAALATAVGNASGPDYDELYATNPILDGTWTTDSNGNPVQNPSGTVNDLTSTTCNGDTTTPTCLPIQTVQGADGRDYRIETFIREDSNTDASNLRWTTRNLWVIVRDADKTSLPEIVELQTSFDRASAG